MTGYDEGYVYGLLDNIDDLKEENAHLIRMVGWLATTAEKFGAGDWEELIEIARYETRE